MTRVLLTFAEPVPLWQGFCSSLSCMTLLCWGNIFKSRSWWFPRQNLQIMKTSPGEHLDRQKFSLWISAAEFPPDDEVQLRLGKSSMPPQNFQMNSTSPGEHLDRQKFSLWISTAEFPPDDNNPKFLLWISAAESPDYDNISRRAFRQAEILAVDFRRRISARSYFDSIFERTTSWE